MVRIEASFIAGLAARRARDLRANWQPSLHLLGQPPNGCRSVARDCRLAQHRERRTRIGTMESFLAVNVGQAEFGSRSICTMRVPCADT